MSGVRHFPFTLIHFLFNAQTEKINLPVFKVISSKDKILKEVPEEICTFDTFTQNENKGLNCKYFYTLYIYKDSGAHSSARCIYIYTGSCSYNVGFHLISFLLIVNCLHESSAKVDVKENSRIYKLRCV